MAEVDTSSYLKPQQTNILDTAAKFQNLEQQKIGIDQSKLKLMNDRYQVLNKELMSLVGQPDLSHDKIQQTGQRLVNLGIIPADMYGEFVKQIPTNPKDLTNYLQQIITKNQNTQEAINYHYGAAGLTQNNQQIIPTLTSNKPGFGGTIRNPNAKPFQIQNPPDTVVTDPNTNQRRLLGPQAEIPTPGTDNRLPVTPVPTQAIKQPSGNINGYSPNMGGTVTGMSVEQQQPQKGPLPTDFNSRFTGQPSGPAVEPPPLFEEGKKQITEDRNNAAARMMRAKPAIEALPLIQTPGFLSGPLTEQFTNAAATLKSLGIIDTAAENDPTAIRQEVSKKLAQYVSGSPVGQRSDAAQILAEASSPNPKTQILPALLKLTKDAVILDRVEAARPNSFKDKDYSKYGEHKSNFPQSIDERAFGLDLEPEDKSAKMVDTMAKKLKSSNSRERNEATKFFKSLRIAKEQGFYQ